ncbi:MAG: TIGR03905 family TSCPD domain-containing protein [Coriobacteriales bacterium]|jgi:uncharacterized protein (TIGR03905 family)|nr:TIGR03905 family TSCPD domain-containing protein [Coriobacteriales bacterium]
MHTYTLAQAKSHFSQVVCEAEAGNRILITRNDEPAVTNIAQQQQQTQQQQNAQQQQAQQQQSQCQQQNAQQQHAMQQQEVEMPLKGVCARSISFSIDAKGIVSDVGFMGGCDGNLKAVAQLAQGRHAKELITCLRGIRCGHKQTSCPDQFAQVLESTWANEQTEQALADD